MDISIPKVTTRYTDKIMQELHDIRFFDDSDEMKKRHSTLKIKEEFVEIPVKTIGMWMSGGADSSLCAWMINKKIRDENLDIKFQPMSVRRGRPSNPIYAGNVIDFIEGDLNITMNDHIIYYPDIADEYQREIKEFRDRDVENFNSGLIEIMYSGITSNPPDNDMSIFVDKKCEPTRNESAEKPLESVSGLAHYINPFFQINKKDIKTLYDDFKLTYTLFPITRSCEGDPEDTGNLSYHCGKCWWCEERMWAFGFLDNPPPQYIYDN